MRAPWRGFVTGLLSLPIRLLEACPCTGTTKPAEVDAVSTELMVTRKAIPNWPPPMQQAWTETKAHFLGSQRRGSATSSVRSKAINKSLISFFACSSTSAQKNRSESTQPTQHNLLSYPAARVFVAESRGAYISGSRRQGLLRWLAGWLHGTRTV